MHKRPMGLLAAAVALPALTPTLAQAQAQSTTMVANSADTVWILISSAPWC